MSNPIRTYFPTLTDHQQRRFDALFDLYKEWNAKINVISRKDIDNLYIHHVLHSLAIAKFISFEKGTKIMDVGTGGGFPGIPLAIFFPDVRFLLLDSIGKKIKVASAISTVIGLQNVEFAHSRVEDEKRIVDFVVSRAVMSLPELVKTTRKNVSSQHKNALPNGIICLKGGDLTLEVKPFSNKVKIIPLTTYFNESFFETKQLVYLPIIR